MQQLTNFGSRTHKRVSAQLVAASLVYGIVLAYLGALMVSR